MKKHLSEPRYQRTPERQASRRNGKTTRANPEEFGKKTSGVRERMARDIKEMAPEERIKQGR